MEGEQESLSAAPPSTHFIACPHTLDRKAGRQAGRHEGFGQEGNWGWGGGTYVSPSSESLLPVCLAEPLTAFLLHEMWIVGEEVSLKMMFCNTYRFRNNRK